MRTPFGAWGLAFTCGLALATGCTGTAPTVADPPTSHPIATLGDVRSTGDRTDAFAAIYEVTLDPGTLEFSQRLVETRSGQQNDDLYGLDVARFFGAEDLRIWNVMRVPPLNAIYLTWGVSHPFDPPTNLDGPATAKNRADLGIAGQLVYLIDVPNAAEHTYFDDVIANAEVVQNADSFVRPAGMLPTTLTANTFPAQTIIDERGIGNRSLISNGGSVFGNYGADGWTRAELGTNNDNWTGYGVLHQGQQATGILKLDTRVLERDGPITFGIGVLVRYNDPRNALDVAERIAHRLPPATPDPLVFAYRMPHGALDCSDTEVVISGGPIVANDVNSAVNLDLNLIDWDARAVVTGEADLSEELDVTKVAVGERGFPLGELDFPRIAGNNPQPVLLDPNGATGDPSNPLHYTVVLTNEIASDQRPGIAAGLVRWTDPENDLTPPLVTPLNSETLQPLSTDFPEAIYYGGIRINIQPPPSSFVYQYGSGTGTLEAVDIAIDPDTGRTFLAGNFYGGFDADPGTGQTTLLSEGNRDCYVIAFDGSGVFEWGVGFGGDQDSLVSAVTLDSLGNPRISGGFGGDIDFDPGAGTAPGSAPNFDAGYCLALQGTTGAFEWVTITQSTAGRVLPWGICMTPQGPVLTGDFDGITDFDHGAGTELRTPVGSYDAFALALTPGGSFRWVAAIGGTQEDRAYNAASDLDGAPIIAGTFQSTVDFDPGNGTSDRTSLGSTDAFVLDLGSDGSFTRVEQLGGGANSPLIADLRLRASDRMLLMSGVFQDALDFDPGPGTVEGSVVGGTDVFVCAWNSDRELAWVSTVGGLNFDAPRGLALTADGGLVLTGQMQGFATVDFDPGPGTQDRTTIGLSDAWFWGLSSDGAYEWATNIGGSITGMFPAAIALAPDTSLRATGSFNNAVDFDPDPIGEQLRLANAPVDVYVVKYSATGEWVP